MTITNERTEDIKHLTQELESEVGSLNLQVITMGDIQTTLGHLRVDMDNVKNLRLQFDEFHRTVRMLDDLMRYNMIDLMEDLKNIQYLKEGLFDAAVREGKVDDETECRPIEQQKKASTGKSKGKL
ncbi:hypothetical protein [Sporosarcina jiandibaonis]|uniref:hypothetical protein n=1 Tax=Sporosarcina jiandibaonis TaxID=2715535 RepID=UPI001554028D|nr:hypothetical protein [Sporosarcina jiandibaonis]